MLELWGRKNAYNVLKVVWLLEELKLDYRHHDLGSNPGDLDSAEFRALNPHGRIPVLRDQGEVVWESNTVLRYLASQYSAGEFWSQDALLRSRSERWMDWELCKLQPDFIDLFWGFYRTPPADRDASLIESAGARCARHFRKLDHELAWQPYLAGERFGIGDISCAVCLYRYFEMGFAVERPENVMRWYRRLAEREAYRDTVMLVFDDLRGRTDY